MVPSYHLSTRLPDLEALCRCSSPALLHPVALHTLCPMNQTSSDSSLSSAQLIPNDDNHPHTVVLIHRNPTPSPAAAPGQVYPPLHTLPIYIVLFPRCPGHRSRLRDLIHALFVDVTANHTNIPTVFLPSLHQWLPDKPDLLPAPLQLQLSCLAALATEAIHIHHSVTFQFWTELHRFISTWTPPRQSQCPPSPLLPTPQQ